MVYSTGRWCRKVKVCVVRGVSENGPLLPAARQYMGPRTDWTNRGPRLHPHTVVSLPLSEARQAAGGPISFYAKGLPLCLHKGAPLYLLSKKEWPLMLAQCFRWRRVPIMQLCAPPLSTLAQSCITCTLRPFPQISLIPIFSKASLFGFGRNEHVPPNP